MPICFALVAITACGGDDRPSDAAWRDLWVSRQALVPTPAEILAGGQDLCGDRVGVFRTEMPALLPSPADELDSAVEVWIAHAETIVFECPLDADELATRFDQLDVLAAEVDAGLAAESTG
jgi:hypothetical protein